MVLLSVDVTDGLANGVLEIVCKCDCVEITDISAVREGIILGVACMLGLTCEDNDICEVVVGVSNTLIVEIVVYDGVGEFVLIVVLDGSCDIDGISEADAYADCDGNKENVEMAVADIVLKGVPEEDCAEDDVRLTSGEGDNVVDSVVVLELVKD